MNTRTVKLPAFLASALINGDLTGLESEADQRLFDEACAALKGGHVVDCGEPFFSWGCYPYFPRFNGEVAEFTILEGES